MKSCPKCQRSFDNSLDFCLEDGTSLITRSVDARTTVEAGAQQTASPTIAYPIAQVREAAKGLSNAAEVETIVAKKEILGTATDRPNKAFEYGAVTIALAHNWWQWLYLEKQYFSGIVDYIFSANFLMWLLLLAGGIAISIFVVRKSENKAFGILSLVILAINLILFLVPKR